MTTTSKAPPSLNAMRACLNALSATYGSGHYVIRKQPGNYVLLRDVNGARTLLSEPTDLAGIIRAAGRLLAEYK